MPIRSKAGGRSEAPLLYQDALRTLVEDGAPFLVGGTFAYCSYTRIDRQTKDLDIFVSEKDRDRVLETLRVAGWETSIEAPHWLAKARRGEVYVDVIHSSGSGLAAVDDLWFEHSVPGCVLGVETRLVPVEEMIWSKAFVMEKYRFDGADIAHLLLARGDRIDWNRLRWRFGRNWRILMGHLLFFGFIYPDKIGLVPKALTEGFVALLRREARHARPRPAPSCRGTLLSRREYRVDIEAWGFRDARLDPDVHMTAHDIESWSRAVAAEPGT